jgi:magnesium-transporting ATPase (P-type)
LEDSLSAADNSTPRPSWWKDILSGFIAWIIAFVIFLIPALVVGISMGFDLGPKLHNNAEVSRRISQAISEMYGSNLYIRIGYIVVLGIVVFWRSWIITRHFAERSILHGTIIGSAAAILAVVQLIPTGAGMHMVIPVVVSIAAGLLGGMKRRSRGTAQ